MWTVLHTERSGGKAGWDTERAVIPFESEGGLQRVTRVRSDTREGLRRQCNMIRLGEDVSEQLCVVCAGLEKRL